MGQHYIPRYYLSGFSENNLLWVHDRLDKASFQTQPKSTGNENRMYSNSGETYLANIIEGPADNILDKAKRLENFTNEDRQLLARYIAIMWLRVPNGRSLITRAVPSVGKAFQQTLSDAAKESVLSIEDKQKIEDQLTKIISNPTPEIWQKLLQTDFYLPIVDDLLSMRWHYLHSKNCDFITSDNPFFRISNSYGSQIIEFSLPLSSSVTLLASRTHEKKPAIISATHALTRQINSRSSLNSTRYIYSLKNEKWMLPFHLKQHKDIHLISQEGRVTCIKS
jgi:hypothetical protein